ncbi:hypothetical protein [Haliscomenobacter sp.]|uniref:hypothetical protein n=1 Tax=Haliscomenobacter sp. TaxID=2717303 RepID=UPI0035940694
MEEKSLRIGDLQMLFEICKEEYNEWKKYDIEIRSLQSLGKHYKFVSTEEGKIPGILFEEYKQEKKINEAKDRSKKSYTKCIIFLAIYLEAFIYDYGATRLGDTYMKKYLERLDVVSKWKIIPKLATNNEIRYDNHKYGYLKEIISLRNSFVHNKTQDIKVILGKKDEKKKRENELTLSTCFECLEFLISEIFRIDQDFSPLINNLDELREIIETK